MLIRLVTHSKRLIFFFFHFREISEEVTERWQRLVTCAEERHKLVTASLNFYKTAEQVCSVLDSLEREYRRDEDWCGSAAAPSTDELSQSQTVDKAAQVSIVFNDFRVQRDELSYEPLNL